MGMFTFIFLLLQWQGSVEYFAFAAGTIADLKRLKDHLFTDYDKELRPVFYISDTVTVTMQLYLLSILDVNEVAGTISFSTGVFLRWKDYRLTWNKTDYAGIDEIVLNSTNVWKPKIFMISAAGDLAKFGSDDFDVRLDSNGTCHFDPAKLVKSTCNVDMTYFPTDYHECSVILTPWGYAPEEIGLSSMDDKIYMDIFNPNGEWEVVDTSAANFYGFGQDANMLSFTLYLRRKSAYYMISMIVPAYILCLLNPFVFLLPASSGERISYTITMFLSLAVYMTLIGDNMPKVSEPMAGISYFLLVSMVLSCILILLTILTLRCHNIYDINTFPKWLIRIVRRFSCGNREKQHVITEKIINTVSENDLHVAEQKDEQMDMSRDIEINDITDFIDKFLFVFTQLVTVAIILGFTLYCFNFL